MPLRFRKTIFMMPDGDANAGGPATETPPEGEAAATEGEAAAPKSDQAPGLLADASKKDGGSVPASEEPAASGEPGDIGERPDYIPEQFWDPATGTLKDEALANSYKEIRNQNNKLMQEKGDKAPEKSEDYLKEYTPPHRTSPAEGEKEGAVMDRYGELSAEDPVFVAMADFAKNGNMSKADFDSGMQKLLETLHPILPEPFNAEKEKEVLGEGADHMIDTNRTWIDTLVRNGVINEDEFNLLLGFGGTALGVQLTNKLRLNSGEKPIPVNLNGGANKGRKTPAECQAMMADERYHADGPAGDAFRAEVDKAFIDTFGTEPA